MAAEKPMGRPRGGAPALTRERILRAALELVDREGMAALSMRRLATALGVDPMAIYYHLDGKAAVIAGLVELAFGELPALPPDSDDWRAQVRAIAGAYRDLALSHPNLILHLVTSAGWAADATLDLNEALFRALEAAGLAPGQALAAADLIVDYTHGYVLGAAGAPSGPPDGREALLALLASRDKASYPALRRALAAAPPKPTADDFMARIELIIAGIAAGKR